MLAGMVMDRPLSIPAILDHAAEVHLNGAVVSAAFPAAGAVLRKEDVLACLATRVAGRQVPDDVLFREALPPTATGEVSKLEPRKLLAGYALPTAA